jgi:hypothetical protein
MALTPLCTTSSNTGSLEAMRVFLKPYTRTYLRRHSYDVVSVVLVLALLDMALKVYHTLLNIVAFQKEDKTMEKHVIIVASVPPMLNIFIFATYDMEVYIWHAGG